MTLSNNPNRNGSDPERDVWQDTRITAYVMGELDDSQHSGFEKDLASNPALQTAVDETRKITEQIGHLFASELQEGLSEGRRESLLTSLAEAQSTDSDPSISPASQIVKKSRKRSAIRLTALAASILLMIGFAGFSLLQHQGQTFLATTVRSANQSLDHSPRPNNEIPFTETPDQLKNVPVEGMLRESFMPPDSTVSEEMELSDQLEELVEIEELEEFEEPVFLGEPEEPRESVLRNSFSNKTQPTPPEDIRSLESRSVSSLQSIPRRKNAYSGGQASNSKVAKKTDSEFSKNIRIEGISESLVVSSYLNNQVDLPQSAANHSLPPMLSGVKKSPNVIGRRQSFDSRAPAEEFFDHYGHRPKAAGDRFDPITDNPFRRVNDHPLSTFSIDVDTASYAKVRSLLTQHNTLPRPDAVRIEELINYFDYGYSSPTLTNESEPPFALHLEMASCPWNIKHRLARIGIKGKTIPQKERPAGNLVFLIDVSGSMNAPNKLPLVKRGLQRLLEQLNGDDRIAIVVYAGAAGIALKSTPADQQQKILDSLHHLSAGGSTNGGDGIRLAYQMARDHFIEKGINRVLLCTDGDFNVGTTGTDSLVRLVEKESKGGVFLSVLGFGMGNHNDAMLEQISGRGEGNYAFIDTEAEAHKVLVEQASSTLVTIAKDVKIQIEFNPVQVASYRLIGYENRILAKEDFNNDQKDAGEMGAGHSVTALYEIVPAGQANDPIAPITDSLRYQTLPDVNKTAQSGECLTLKIRYKLPAGGPSKRVQKSIHDQGADLASSSNGFQFAAAVAGFGMQLRNSPHKGNWTYDAIHETAQSAIRNRSSERKSEFLSLVKKAAHLSRTP